MAVAPEWAHLGLRAGYEARTIMDPVIERPLLGIYRATNIDSFWKAARRLLSAASLTTSSGRHSSTIRFGPRREKNPAVANGFFDAEPLGVISAATRKRFVQISDLFSNRSRNRMRSFIAVSGAASCRHDVTCSVFWKNQSLICAITIMRTAAQGDYARGDEIAPATAPTISDRSSPARIARARAFSAHSL